jgi:hypothetical protein
MNDKQVKQGMELLEEIFWTLISQQSDIIQKEKLYTYMVLFNTMLYIEGLN